MSENLLAEAAKVRRDRSEDVLSPLEASALRARIDAQLAHRKQRTAGLRFRLAVACVMASVVIVVASLVIQSDPSAPSWYRVISGESCIVADIAALRVISECPGGVRVAVKDDEVELGSGSELSSGDGILRLRSGRAVFWIEGRTPDAEPFALAVSHGRIIVRGTRFEVVQRQDSGNITVHEGSVDFVDAFGATSGLSVGDSYDWPHTPQPSIAPSHRDDVRLDEVPTPKPVELAPPSRDLPPKTAKSRPPSESPPARAPTPAHDMRGLVARLSILRSQGRYRDAATLLKTELSDPRLTDTQRESLHYDLAVLLDDEIGERQEACDEWRMHLSDFPNGLHAANARMRLSRCPN